MTSQVSGQGEATPVIVPTSEQDGQVTNIRVPFVPKKEQEIVQGAEQKSANDEARKARLSNAEWQTKTEEIKKAEQLKEAVKETLGVENPSDMKAEVMKLRQEMETLREDNVRKEWEKSHPIVDSDKYIDEWKDMLKKKGHLLKSGDLSYDDLWKLINRERSVSRELKEQPSEQFSVPLSSRVSIPHSGIDSEILEMGQVGGLTAEDYKRAGLLH